MTDNETNGASEPKAAPKAARKKRAKIAIEVRQLFTSVDVAALLGVNPSSINKWTTEGRIHGIRTPGGHRRYTRAALLDFALGWPELCAGLLDALKPDDFELKRARDLRAAKERGAAAEEVVVFERDRDGVVQIYPGSDDPKGAA